MTTITAADLAQDLSDVLDRVRYHGEQFRIERDGEPVALLGPTGGAALFTVGDFIALLDRLPRPDDEFAADLEEIHASQDVAEAPAWPN